MWLNIISRISRYIHCYVPREKHMLKDRHLFKISTNHIEKMEKEEARNSIFQRTKEMVIYLSNRVDWKIKTLLTLGDALWDNSSPSIKKEAFSKFIYLFRFFFWYLFYNGCCSKHWTNKEPETQWECKWGEKEVLTEVNVEDTLNWKRIEWK